ncbi:hypothetical protein IC232_04235 [Microvirga sp. BT688]|uniref:hypothetical protein n=1 Tax=Microvirga sp. TaxID=1873136 RepID=UPI0016847886|nr:hypothetical protein [Microvirga sp.]MBD2745902.1 hypothetical protein [Microvirga sp.]
MSRNPFEDLCHSIDPNGTVHTVPARTYREIGSMEAFKKHWPATGFSTKFQGDLEEFTRVSPDLPPDEQQRRKLVEVFPRFSGKLVEHASPKAFFEAIGYVGEAKRKCRNGYRRWKRAALFENGVRLISTAPFRVTLNF